MAQTWNDLLFAHWPVDRALLRARVPAGLDLDLFEGQAWLGMVPFRMTNVAPRGVPVWAWLSSFPEVNVRTYVRVGDEPGVYFFSLDADSRLAVTVGRTMFHLPYYRAAMQVEERGGAIEYQSRRARGSAEFSASYAPKGGVFQAREGSLDYFLTERYCFYATSGRRILHTEIHHPPWPLQRAEAAFRANTMTDPIGIRLPDVTPLLHFAKRQDVVSWAPANAAPAR